MEEENEIKIELDVSVYPKFDLEKAICNHGFFMLAPNEWLHETKTLKRPIRLHRNSHESLVIFISQPSYLIPKLIIRVCAQSITDIQRYTILNQVKRMLRLSQKDEKDVREWHDKHEEAKENGFGRLFRSVSIFEDAVKSILLCNCTWKNTLEMAHALCANQPLLAAMLEDQTDNINNPETLRKKRKISHNAKSKPRCINFDELEDHYRKTKPTIFSSTPNFPNSKELSMIDDKFLRERCNLGFRAKWVINLVSEFEEGKLNLDEIDQKQVLGLSVSHEDLSYDIEKTKGIGPFTRSNILMCLGFYHQVPIDTETVRLIKMVHGKTDCTKENSEKYVKEIYSRYGQFQCLAYWLDLMKDYESSVGKLSELPSSSYPIVNGKHTIMSNPQDN